MTVKLNERDRTEKLPPSAARRIEYAAMDANGVNNKSGDIIGLANKLRQQRLNYNDVREIAAEIIILATQQQVDIQMMLRKMKHAGANKIEPTY